MDLTKYLRHWPTTRLICISRLAKNAGGIFLGELRHHVERGRTERPGTDRDPRARNGTERPTLLKTWWASVLISAFALVFFVFGRTLEEFMGQNGINQSTAQYMAPPENKLPAHLIVNHCVSMYFPRNGYLMVKNMFKQIHIDNILQLPPSTSILPPRILLIPRRTGRRHDAPGYWDSRPLLWLVRSKRVLKSNSASEMGHGQITGLQSTTSHI